MLILISPRHSTSGLCFSRNARRCPPFRSRRIPLTFHAAIVKSPFGPVLEKMGLNSSAIALSSVL